MIRAFFLPAGTDPAALPILVAKALRAFADGCVAVVLPAYLLALGLTAWEVGLVATATLLGSAFATLAVGAWGHRFPAQKLLPAAALLMLATGCAFALQNAFWPLLVIAFVGTLNPSSGDVSVFLPLEQARLADASQQAGTIARTALFARYSLLGALFAACGALFAGAPEWVATSAGVAPLTALRGVFVAYGVIGAFTWLLYHRLPAAAIPLDATSAPAPATALGISRPAVIRLVWLFSLDAFAGGLVINGLLALWLFQRFGLSLAAAGQFFFWAGLLAAISQLAAPAIARRIGLLNTMVFTHLPANVLLLFAALAPRLDLAITLLLARALLSQMDVPTRSAFVMSVVTPAERAAAASFTAIPRSLAAAVGPTLGGALLAAGYLAAPLIACGSLKIVYDLAIWRAFAKHA